jgi:galactose-1-phosphate uridylyltransferase
MSGLERHLLSARMRDPASGEERVTRIELRVDPLSGHTSRILPDRGLMPRNEFDLEAFARETEPSCPFCRERIEQTTPLWPAAITPDGRFRNGEAILFPNLHAYATYSSVSVYSPKLHFLPLGAFTTRLLADNLSTQVAFARAVTAADPQAIWASVNANHMLPSGSSLFHPHLQGIVDHHPTTMQRLLAALLPGRFTAYIDDERRAGERHLGNTGSVEWLASFAPIAPAELRAFIPAASSPAELDDALVEELAHGLALALGAYSELGFESFNLAIYGAPAETDGYMLNLRLAARSNLKPLYRSDSTFLERLHWEGAVDISPEQIAESIGDRFRI